MSSTRWFVALITHSFQHLANVHDVVVRSWFDREPLSPIEHLKTREVEGAKESKQAAVGVGRCREHRTINNALNVSFIK